MRILPDDPGDDEDEGWRQRMWEGLYTIYNRCMVWSCALNDWAGFKLWRIANEE